MELKDVILSTLAEMEDNEVTKKILINSVEPEKIEIKKIQKIEKTQHSEPKLVVEPIVKEVKKPSVNVAKEVKKSSVNSEFLFLDSFRERLLVLFEGFQSPDNIDIEDKVDLTLNFLEYALATIDERAEELKKGE